MSTNNDDVKEIVQNLIEQIISKVEAERQVETSTSELTEPKIYSAEDKNVCCSQTTNLVNTNSEEEEDEDDDKDDDSSEEDVSQLLHKTSCFPIMEDTEMVVLSVNGTPEVYFASMEKATNAAKDFALKLSDLYNRQSVWRRYSVYCGRERFEIRYTLPFMFSIYDSLSDSITLTRISESDIGLY